MHKLYVAEGEKIVLELIRSGSGEGHRVMQLFATEKWIGHHRLLIDENQVTPEVASPSELKKLSTLVTPPPVMALVAMPQTEFDPAMLVKQTVLGFESIRDPGNLGTIIRTADWFGIRQIVCSPDSVDLFNPKVVQSTMGAIARMKVDYHDIEKLFSHPDWKGKIICGTFPKGESLFETELGKDPFILFGNESHGLSIKFNRYMTRKISIPSCSASGSGTESLNVASSVAIICAEIRRRGQHA